MNAQMLAAGVISTKRIPGYGGGPKVSHYTASDQGDIRSHWRNGKTFLLSPTLSKWERYSAYVVNLCNETGHHVVYVPRAVMLAHVGPRPEGQQIRHLNGNSLDNRLRNLSYGTSLQDAQDKADHGTICNGVKHWKASFSEDEVLALYDLACAGDMTGLEIAAMFSTTKATVSDIKHGRSWSHVTGHQDNSRRGKRLRAEGKTREQ